MPARDKGVLIKAGGTQKDGGVLRARDVEFELRAVEVHPNIKSILCRLAEINHFNMLKIAECVTMLDQLINIVQQFSDVAENMKNAMSRLQRETGVDDDVTTRD